MKKIDLILGIMLVIFISGCINQSELTDIDKIKNISRTIFPLKDKQNISIVLSGERYIPEGMTSEQETRALLQNKYFAKENINLDVRFINMGKEIKILNVFEPIPIFFSLRIEREDGTSIIVPSGGKISFMGDSLDYITLEGPGDQHYVTLKLDKVLPDGLDVGTYTVSAEYHNQYGENCFKGSLKSDPVILNVVEKTPEEILFEETYRKYIDNPKYCEKDADCGCMVGSGVPFLGCGNFLYSGPGGFGSCPECGCVSGTCKKVS